jgi:hypothetical protein
MSAKNKLADMKVQTFQDWRGGDQNSYLCTYDLYGPVRNAFDAASIHYEGNWEGVGP